MTELMAKMPVHESFARAAQIYHRKAGGSDRGVGWASCRRLPLQIKASKVTRFPADRRKTSCCWSQNPPGDKKQRVAGGFFSSSFGTSMQSVAEERGALVHWRASTTCSSARQRRSKGRGGVDGRTRRRGRAVNREAVGSGVTDLSCRQLQQMLGEVVMSLSALGEQSQSRHGSSSRESAR